MENLAPYHFLYIERARDRKRYSAFDQSNDLASRPGIVFLGPRAPIEASIHNALPTR